MHKHVMLLSCLLFALCGTAMAKDQAPDPSQKDKTPAAKELSGMSIVGNDEAPKSLYIVPWKGSEIGAETTLHRMLTEQPGPVDREEFIRELDFYDSSTRK